MSLSLPRETGIEKSGLICPRCATELPAVTSTYGSVVAGACPVCWPEQAPTQLVAQQAAAEPEPEEPESESLDG